MLPQGLGFITFWLPECLWLEAHSSGAGAARKTRTRFVFLFPSLPVFFRSRWTTLAEFYLDTLIWSQSNLFRLKVLKRKSQRTAGTRQRFHQSWPTIRFFFESATPETVCCFTPGILTAHFSLAGIAASWFMSFLTQSYQVLPFTLPFYPCVQMRFREAEPFSSKVSLTGVALPFAFYNCWFQSEDRASL